VARKQYVVRDNVQQTGIQAPGELERTISVGERPQTYALDRAATGTDIEVSSYELG
jgi:hypothetical protein